MICVCIYIILWCLWGLVLIYWISIRLIKSTLGYDVKLSSLCVACVFSFVLPQRWPYRRSWSMHASSQNFKVEVALRICLNKLFKEDADHKCDTCILVWNVDHKRSCFLLILFPTKKKGTWVRQSRFIALRLIWIRKIIQRSLTRIFLLTSESFRWQIR